MVDEEQIWDESTQSWRSVRIQRHTSEHLHWQWDLWRYASLAAMICCGLALLVTLIVVLVVIPTKVVRRTDDSSIGECNTPSDPTTTFHNITPHSCPPSGNCHRPNCTDLGYRYGFRVDDIQPGTFTVCVTPQDGVLTAPDAVEDPRSCFNYTVSQDGRAVTVFDSTIPVDAILVRGTNCATNHYAYPTPADHDTGLAAPPFVPPSELPYCDELTLAPSSSDAEVEISNPTDSSSSEVEPPTPTTTQPCRPRVIDQTYSVSSGGTSTSGAANPCGTQNYMGEMGSERNHEQRQPKLYVGILHVHNLRRHHHASCVSILPIAIQTLATAPLEWRSLLDRTLLDLRLASSVALER